MERHVDASMERHVHARGLSPRRSTTASVTTVDFSRDLLTFLDSDLKHEQRHPYLSTNISDTWTTPSVRTRQLSVQEALRGCASQPLLIAQPAAACKVVLDPSVSRAGLLTSNSLQFQILKTPIHPSINTTYRQLDPSARARELSAAAASQSHLRYTERE